jgi:hypothetical protein
MSDFLFASSSWLTGCARTLDLAALFDDYNISLTPAQADWLALYSDSAAIYKDFWKAYENCTKDIELNGHNHSTRDNEEELSLAL